MKTKGIYLLYRSLQAFGFPLLLVYLLLRSFRTQGYRRTITQRFGWLPRSFRQTSPGAIWLHAVSVGEVVSSAALIRELRRELPTTPLFLSVSTLAGREMAEQKAAPLVNGIFFAPLDFTFVVRRVLRTLRPSVVVVLETEIWPNLFREARRSGAGLLLLNGRISDRALPRYRRMGWFFRHVLPHADSILVQSEQMKERFSSIGAPTDRIVIGGNLKYDFQPAEADPLSPVRRLLDRVQPGSVWIAASTMPPAQAGDPDEDDAVISAFQEVAARKPKLLLILAPRRPERFESAAAKLEQAGIRFLHRSRLTGAETLPLPGVLLVDSIGELSGLFGLADVVFMGGSLASRGGHNPLEPASFGRPIIAGPHMENFREIEQDFDRAGGWMRISGTHELPFAVLDLLGDAPRATLTGELARSCAEARRGATERAAREICRLHAQRFACGWPSLAARIFLGGLAKIWELGGARKRARGQARRRRLEQPVISIGNITVGGTGKTPFVLYLVEHLKQTGHYPGILTRGYGRRSPLKHLLLPAGSQIAVEHSGDEAQILLRSGLAPVGIGPDRFYTGQALARDFGVDVFVLDDGFQHVQLERQLDILLVDALNPFGGCRVFPLGRLREPLEQLTRADIFVITRSNYAAALDTIEHVLAKHNPGAPIFHARVVPERWIEFSTGRQFPADEPPFSRAGAFCGLGNPNSFWHTLHSLGIEVVAHIPFEDHHLYKPHEMRRISHQLRGTGAQAVVTTEKDTFNLCDGCMDLLAPLPLYWLKIRLEIVEEAQFLERVALRSEIHD